jgi:hypothetical protein
MARYYALCSMKIRIPHPKKTIANAVIVMLPEDSTEISPLERRAGITRLLQWARETHDAHPNLPEYKGKSYLPEPNTLTPDMTDAEFAERGITISQEVRPFFPISEVEADDA